MNKKQMIVLWIGIIIFVLVSLHPPRKSHPRPIRRTTDAPIVEVIGAGNVDGVKLLSRWLIIIILTGGLIYTIKDKKDKKLKDEQNQ